MSLKWPRFFFALLCVLLVSSAGTTARADENTDRFERTVQELQRETQVRFDAELPPGQRALIDYGGYLTLGYLSVDDAAHDNHGLRQYQLVGYGRVNLDDVHEFYFRGRTEYDNYNAGDAYNHEPDHLEGYVEEGWYRFDLQHFAASRGQTVSYDLSLKAGRQFVDWGNGLTLDQYVDGIAAQYSGPVVIDLLAAVTVPQTIDFDTSRPDFDDNTRRGYYGAKLTVPVGRQNPYAYFLLQRDYNRAQSPVTHLVTTDYNYDSYYVGTGSNGALSDNFTYAAEVCYEGGHGLSDSLDALTGKPTNQSDDRIEAWAANGRVDYLLNDSRKTRFSVQAVFASGDTDRQNTEATFGGNLPHTADRAFNSLGVIYDGLAFTPPVSNLLMLRLGASTYPAPVGRLHGLQVG
ncbi:MAG TPA: hypothetical protein VFE47_08265, partial [Tepidisphaeraceae bacterium]|nr:hypothetical protein [Tepidisphaeraceae bacterium]